MFEPEHKSHFYLILFCVIAIFLGWSIYTQYKPMLIQASCSEIAAGSSGLINNESDLLDPSYSYNNIRSKCLQDSGIK